MSVPILSSHINWINGKNCVPKRTNKSVDYSGQSGHLKVSDFYF